MSRRKAIPTLAKFKAEKHKGKVCPLLDQFEQGRTVCLNCPLWYKEKQTGYCILDRPGIAAKLDFNKLVEVRDKMMEVLKGVSNAE